MWTGTHGKNVTPFASVLNAFQTLCLNLCVVVFKFSVKRFAVECFHTSSHSFVFFSCTKIKEKRRAVEVKSIRSRSIHRKLERPVEGTVTSSTRDILSYVHMFRRKGLFLYGTCCSESSCRVLAGHLVANYFTCVNDPFITHVKWNLINISFGTLMQTTMYCVSGALTFLLNNSCDSFLCGCNEDAQLNRKLLKFELYFSMTIFNAISFLLFLLSKQKSEESKEFVNQERESVEEYVKELEGKLEMMRKDLVTSEEVLQKERMISRERDLAVQSLQ